MISAAQVENRDNIKEFVGEVEINNLNYGIVSIVLTKHISPLCNDIIFLIHNHYNSSEQNQSLWYDHRLNFHNYYTI